MRTIEPQLLRRPKLSEEIVRQLERRMLSGELKPGDQLPSERQLMEAFGVGRPSVREALFALHRMGLVAIRNGERAYVTAPTVEALIGELSGAARHMLARPHGVHEFQEARAFFEIALARHAAKHAAENDLEKLGRALEKNRRAVGSTALFIETDVAFHYVLAEIPRNPIFTALHAAIADWLEEQRTTSARIGESARAAYRAHKRIFAAIAARDPDAAERAMQSHLEEVGTYYWRAKGANP